MLGVNSLFKVRITEDDLTVTHGLGDALQNANIKQEE